MPTDSNTLDSFLAGIPVPVQPAAIERELAALWKPSSEQADSTATTAVTRVCLANLVVIGRAADSAWLGTVQQELSTRYPCRILSAQIDETSPNGELQAAVTALCHLPTPGSPQVCSEQILLQTGRAGVGLLPGAVLPLLEADLPVILWWAMPAESEPGLFDALCKVVDRVIVHPEPLSSPTARSGTLLNNLQLCLRPNAAGKATVLLWHKMVHWRDLTAQLFDDPQLRPALDQLARLIIRYTSQTASPDFLPPATLLAGWIAGQLNWQPQSRQLTGGDLSVAFSRKTGSGTIQLELLSDQTPPLTSGYLLSVDLIPGEDSKEMSFHLTRSSSDRSSIRQVICISDVCRVLKSVAAADQTDAQVLGAAIESLSSAEVFPRAARLALWLMGLKTTVSESAS